MNFMIKKFLTFVENFWILTIVRPIIYFRETQTGFRIELQSQKGRV